MTPSFSSSRNRRPTAVAKERSYGEIYNDLDGDVINLFRVLQHECLAERLIELLRLVDASGRQPVRLRHVISWLFFAGVKPPLVS